MNEMIFTRKKTFRDKECATMIWTGNNMIRLDLVKNSPMHISHLRLNHKQPRNFKHEPGHNKQHRQPFGINYTHTSSVFLPFASQYKSLNWLGFCISTIFFSVFLPLALHETSPEWFFVFPPHPLRYSKHHPNGFLYFHPLRYIKYYVSPSQ